MSLLADSCLQSLIGLALGLKVSVVPQLRLVVVLTTLLFPQHVLDADLLLGPSIPPPRPLQQPRRLYPLQLQPQPVPPLPLPQLQHQLAVMCQQNVAKQLEIILTNLMT